MAKPARKTKPAHERHRATAVKKAGAAIGTASVTASLGQTQADTARAAIVMVMRTWHASKMTMCMRGEQLLNPKTGVIGFVETEPRIANAAEVNAFIRADFGDLKKRAGAGAVTEQKRVNPDSTAAELNAARRNGSKGVRQRRRPFENFQECLENDPQVAGDSVAEASKLSWTEKCVEWASTKTTRCEESRMKVVIGTDDDGCVHALGENYKDAYEVDTRPGPDGKPEEYCMVTVGPKGATENITVVIDKAPSGEVYQQMRRVVVESRNLLSNARKFLSDVEDDETLEQFEIPTVAE